MLSIFIDFFCQFSICRFLSTISMIIMQTFLTTAKYYKITSRSGLIFVIDYTRIISRIIFNITYNDKMGRRWTKTALLAATLVVMVLVCTCLRMYKRGRLCLQIPMGIKPTRNLPTHFENRHPRYTLEALHESADVGSNNNNCCLSFCWLKMHINRQADFGAPSTTCKIHLGMHRECEFPFPILSHGNRMGTEMDMV